MRSARGWASLLLALVAGCGGLYASEDGERGAAAGGQAPEPSPASMADGCGGAAGAPPSCGGEAGQASSPSPSWIHTACNLGSKVNRRGAPVTIDCRIK